MELRGLTSDFL